MKQNYSAEQVSISHAEYIKLHKENLLVLGVDNDLATRAASAGLGPKKGGTSAAYHFYSWVSIGVFVLSIYFSFISNWWWFIVGFISMMVIWNGNGRAITNDIAILQAKLNPTCGMLCMTVSLVPPKEQ